MEVRDLFSNPKSKIQNPKSKIQIAAAADRLG